MKELLVKLLYKILLCIKKHNEILYVGWCVLGLLVCIMFGVYMAKDMAANSISDSIKELGKFVVISVLVFFGVTEIILHIVNFLKDHFIFEEESTCTEDICTKEIKLKKRN